MVSALTQQPEVMANALPDEIACRLCGSHDLESVINLGSSQLANNYAASAQKACDDASYELHAVICNKCRLMQLTASPPPEAHFTDYRYFSSYSTTMVEHARRYAEMCIERFGLNANSQVVELASNDGYLLQHFKVRHIPVLGIEPAENVAEVAREKQGIRTIARFFGCELARELVADGIIADLIAANNVLAHVPDINDFVAGIALLLAPEGVVTVEFPDVENLLKFGQFDTIYHEHFSYLSLPVVQRLFARHGLKVFDAEALSVHGGSLRIYGCHHAASHTIAPTLATMLSAVDESMEAYQSLAPKTEKIKRDLLSFLHNAKADGKRVAAYGAAAKGNTLLNFCGITSDLIAYAVDASPHKQGLYLPGSAIPILAPAELKRTKPEFVLILPWNLSEEIIKDHEYIRQWGGRFVTAIPDIALL